MTEVADTDGYWLGPAEEHLGRRQEHCRHHDGANGIYVFDRVERKPPHHFRCSVPEGTGHEAVRHLVHGDGEKNGDDGNRDELDEIGAGASVHYNGARPGQAGSRNVTSPVPRRMISGAGPVRSMTDVGCTPQAPPSTTAASRPLSRSLIS